MILTNIRSRISSLDNEIVRLGGSALVSNNASSESCGFAIIPSVAPFPPVKKPRGRPRKQSDNTEKESSTEKKKRGRPPKKQENEVSKTKDDPPKPIEAMSPLTSIATSLISLKTGDLDPKVAIYKANASETKVVDTIAATDPTAASDDASKQEDWLCPCGSMIDHKKVRCGQCRKWKDGKRKTRWSFKDKENGGGNKKSKSGKKKKTAESVYAKLSGADTELQASDSVESVLGNMVTAVCEVGVEKKKRKSSGEKSKKPKRSRSNDSNDQERKASVVTLDEPIEENETPPFAFESLMQAVAMQINSAQEPSGDLQLVFSC